MKSATITQITIYPRFRGPIDSANGGYVGGLLAKNLVGDQPIAVKVKLKSPPPINQIMTINTDDDNNVLKWNKKIIATAEITELALEVPVSPGIEVAKQARQYYQQPQYEELHECFVCGPKRQQGDGLCIFPAPFDQSNTVIDSWVPDASLDDGNGRVAHEFLWAGLDCPGFYAHRRSDMLALLGEMSAKILHYPRIGQMLISLGWQIRVEGRKYYSGTALFDAGSNLMALASQVWIKI